MTNATRDQFEFLNDLKVRHGPTEAAFSTLRYEDPAHSCSQVTESMGRAGKRLASGDEYEAGEVWHLAIQLLRERAYLLVGQRVWQLAFNADQSRLDGCDELTDLLSLLLGVAIAAERTFLERFMIVVTGADSRTIESIKGNNLSMFSAQPLMNNIPLLCPERSARTRSPCQTQSFPSPGVSASEGSTSAHSDQSGVSKLTA